MRVRRRLYGVVFVVLITLACWLSYADYKHAFSDTVPVTASLAGGQLLPEAMVKMRGVLVGEVRDVDTQGEGLTAQIAVDRDHADEIPAGVTARLLPTTLFGEYYVDLVPPPSWRPSTGAPTITPEAVIPQDHSTATLELQQALADLYPLLRTVRPADLNATLYAWSTALEGRGDAVGDNLQRVDAYLRRFNPSLRTAMRDFDKLADVSHTYADAAPDLARLLRHSAFTGRTVVEQRQALAAFYVGLSGMATTMRTTLSENETNLVRLASTSRGPLELFARYSPQFPCLLTGLAEFHPLAAQTFATGRLHISLETVRQREQYGQDESPAYADRRGPNCQTLPDPHIPGTTPLGGYIKDGTRGPEEYREPTDAGGEHHAGGPGGGQDLADLLTAR